MTRVKYSPYIRRRAGICPRSYPNHHARGRNSMKTTSASYIRNGDRYHYHDLWHLLSHAYTGGNTHPILWHRLSRAEAILLVMATHTPRRAYLRACRAIIKIIFTGSYAIPPHTPKSKKSALFSGRRA